MLLPDSAGAVGVFELAVGAACSSVVGARRGDGTGRGDCVGERGDWVGEVTPATTVSDRRGGATGFGRIVSPARGDLGIVASLTGTGGIGGKVGGIVRGDLGGSGSFSGSFGTGKRGDGGCIPLEARTGGAGAAVRGASSGDDGIIAGEEIPDDGEDPAKKENLLKHNKTASISSYLILAAVNLLATPKQQQLATLNS